MSRAWEDGQNANWATVEAKKRTAYLEGKVDGLREALDKANDRLADQDPALAPKRRRLRAV